MKVNKKGNNKERQAQMIKTEREIVEKLLNMAMTHSNSVCDSLESQEYDVASSHAQDLKQVLYVLLDYVQHFTYCWDD